MADMHRPETDEKMAEVAEKQQQLQSIDAADLVSGDANESNHDNNNKAESHNNEGDMITHVMQLTSAANLAQNGGEYNEVLVGTAENTTTMTTTRKTTEYTVVKCKEATVGSMAQSGVGAEVVETLERESGSVVKEKEKKVVRLEYVDNGEEVIELNFNLDKFEQHAPHCPNCKHQITMLILRKIQPQPQPDDTVLAYCKRCVTFVQTTVTHYVHSIWRKFTQEITPDVKDPNTIVEPPVRIPTTIDPGNGTAEEDENKEEVEGANGTAKEDENKGEVEGENGTAKEDENKGEVEGENGTAKEDENNGEVEGENGTGDQTGGNVPIVISIKGEVDLVEMLKCIVYGGLNESITSLTVVAAVAATDATTLNVLAIGVALLCTSLIGFGMNLAELKKETDDKYKDLLGGIKGKFVSHAIFVILSYLVFGLIAPTTFAFAFRESDHKAYKIVAAASAAFACIFILAMAQAYVKSRTYVETTRKYLVLAILTSGVAYALGCTTEMYVLKSGWFTSVPRVTC